MNRIIIDTPEIKKNTILYHYKVSGDWEEAFTEDIFSIEYSADISSLPLGIAIVPLMCNILPIAWVYDAEIVAPVCDKDFYESISDLKKGYIEMYPMIHFGGNLNIQRIEENRSVNTSGSLAFFSGGVDAFSTLIHHREEHPELITLWGSDVFFDDEIGWNKVKKHIEETSSIFDVNYIVVKSGFRRFLNEGILGQKVRISGDGWWHGFQHGIGLIGHAAPLAYMLKKNTVYIASTYTIAEKDIVTCASDPFIDNHIRFCGAQVIHDGYELSRQDKIHNITVFSEETRIPVSLRVCWESRGGGNCCNCEKCWRTILGILAEGCDPHDYGFQYNREMLNELSKKMRYYPYDSVLKTWYSPIQTAMRKNLKKEDLPKEIRWFYEADTSRLGAQPLWKKAEKKIVRIVKKLKKH